MHIPWRYSRSMILVNLQRVEEQYVVGLSYLSTYLDMENNHASCARYSTGNYY